MSLRLASLFVPVCWMVAAPGPLLGEDGGPLQLQSGDRIVFVGDELLEVNELNRTPTFPVLVETFLAVRYPKLRVSYENVAWSGDAGERVLLRLDRDVLSRTPTTVVLCLGMNDARYSHFEGHEQFLEDYKKHLVAIVQRCKDVGARVWLVSPAGVWEDSGQLFRLQRDADVNYIDLGKIRYNGALAHYVDAMREIAKEHGVGFVDWFALMEAKRQELQPSKELHNDYYMASEPRIPRTAGQLIAATAVLKAWGAQPIDAEIRVNWVGGTIQAAHRMEGSPRSLPAELTVHADGRRVIEVKDLPVPWPIPGARTSLSEEHPATEDLCRIRLYVEHAPDVGVTLSREPAGEIPGAELAIPAARLERGYNLAAVPIMQVCEEGSELARHVTFKNTYLFNAWRKLELNPPKELELVEPQRQLVAVWREYAAAYEKLIAQSSKLYALECELSETKPKPKEEPPATQPTSTAPRPALPPLAPPPRQ